MLDKILGIISIHLSIPVEELREEMTFVELGMDSLTLMKIIMGIENIFDIHIEDEEIVELRDITDIFEVSAKKVSF
ncbi:MAG: acyl carrier protein [Clostridia bacterium]|nr:acyl carrier protein [Clostridia bacterium]